jgi:hypothetical protein
MADSSTYEVRVRREIRDALAIDPLATIPELTARLNERLNRSFDPRYIKKLTDKVTRQLITESDRRRPYARHPRRLPHRARSAIVDNPFAHSGM